MYKYNTNTSHMLRKINRSIRLIWILFCCVGLLWFHFAKKKKSLRYGVGVFISLFQFNQIVIVCYILSVLELLVFKHWSNSRKFKTNMLSILKSISAWFITKIKITLKKINQSNYTKTSSIQHPSVFTLGCLMRVLS